jgi:hypothetical protein
MASNAKVLSRQERIEVVKLYNRYNSNAHAVSRVFSQTHVGDSVHPTTVTRINRHFDEYGCVDNAPKSGGQDPEDLKKILPVSMLQFLPNQRPPHAAFHLNMKSIIRLFTVY